MTHTDSSFVAPFHIAIDGPTSAGKGTVSRLVAQELNFLYVDTGAMYRVVALLAIQNDISFADEEALVTVLQQTSLEMHTPAEHEKDGRLITVLVNGEDVSWKIRTEEVSTQVSKVATLAKIRAILVEKQQQIAAGQHVVMEGRDITYKVLPDAQLKIFLTANDAIRAKRRYLQLQSKGEAVELSDVYRDLIERDERDQGRAIDPLRIVPDAWVIDTSELNIDEVVDLIVAKTRALKEEHGTRN